MRTLFIITCFANIAFAFGTLPWMPEKAAIHFDGNGIPNGWASPITNAVLLSLITVFIGAIIFFCSFMVAMIAKHMPEHANIPNRDYWLNEVNRPKTIRRLCVYTEFIGIGTMLIILLAQWEIFRANQMVPPKLPTMGNLLFATILFLIVFAIESVRLYLSFRLPKGTDSLRPLR